MSKYIVEVPLTGYISIEVIAENKEEAIDIAYERATLEDVEEWELHKHVSQGNCCHALRNGIEIFEVTI